MQKISLLALACVSPLIHAHEGHGLEGASHYLASDAFGVVLFVAIGLAAWWLGTRK